jgi:2-amino-4-hydroxy-6-hydroxymethyldihydropteridine diphosphokinase
MDTTGKSRFLIALGANLGDRAAALAAATAHIARDLGEVTAEAPVYRTAPVGAATQEFLNSALVCASELAPDEAMRRLLAIEAALGRVRRERWGDRIIDLDLLAWWPRGQAQCAPHDSALVTLPHPRLLERDFALVPAAQVAGDWQLAPGGPTLADECRARSYVATQLGV